MPKLPHQTALADHIGVDLWRAYRTYERVMYQRVAAIGFPDIAVADGDILVHISAEGTRLADIAKSHGLTKQSIHERVHSLISRGYLALSADPQDKRVKIVELTERGRELTLALKKVKQTLHSEAMGALGAADMAKLREMLSKVDVIYK